MIDWSGTSNEKKAVLVTCVFLFATFGFMGVFMENTVAVSRYGNGLSTFSGDLPIGYDPIGEDASSNRIRAIVKGSIYETGDNMTVFGACFDGDGYLLPEAEVEFTAWYPNGTVMLGPFAPMYPILEGFEGTSINSSGRWGIHVTMGNTVGTYLTEMRCTYEDQWAIAFGEWQNPAWVVRIRSIDDQVSNISQVISQFQNNTNTNLTQIINSINQISIADVDVNPESFFELHQHLRSIDPNLWVVDKRNPFFITGSDAHNFASIDMLNERAIVAASYDGYVVWWDGDAWEEQLVSSAEFRDVSILPATNLYYWAVGTNGANPRISINGNALQALTLPGGSPTAFNAVKLFQSPTNPSGAYLTYLLGDDGSLYRSINSASSFTLEHSLDAEQYGSISQIVENHGVNAQQNSYMMMAGQGSTVVVGDGLTYTQYGVSGDVRGVELIYHNLGYVITKDITDSKIYIFNGTNMTLDHTIQNAQIEPTGIAANGESDVWVVTKDPSTFYHFNGRNWQYSAVGFGAVVAAVINFNSVNATQYEGIQSIVMRNHGTGYAVGGDGIILRYQSHSNDQFEKILTMMEQDTQEILLGLQNITVGNVTFGNLSSAMSFLTNFVIEFNESTSQSLEIIDFKLDQFNVSVQYELENILNNVTYTQLYLETTLMPMLNATYQNTLLILQQLGIIEAQINQTIELQNQTINIVNQTAQDVDELLNRSRRIRAWVTP